jgi:hypothetical protein
MMRRPLEWGAELAERRPRARSRGRRVAFLAILALVLAVIGGATGLLKSGRGQSVMLLALVLAVLIGTHRSNGTRALARALLEYAAVGTFAALLAITIAGSPAAHKPKPSALAPKSTAHQQTAQVAGVVCAQLERVHLAAVCQRLSQLQRRASTEAGRRLTPPTTTTPSRKHTGEPPGPRP